jgi:uncharacterized protein (TIGR02996 family)
MLEALLQKVVDHPEDGALWPAIIDWLHKHDDPRRAELVLLHRRLLASCTEPNAHPERADWQVRVVALLAAGVRPVAPLQTILAQHGVDVTLVWIPPGTFLMGSPAAESQRGDDETQRQVTVNGFWLGTHPVTQKQWQILMGRNPSKTRGVDLPVHAISWDDCQEFIAELKGPQRQRFRLPTEAEWEYACRAGTSSPFFSGETISTDQANYDGNHAYGPGSNGVFRGAPTRIGHFPPNAWNLYDMHGNIWEWCADQYTQDGQDQKGDKDARVLRGGSWNFVPWLCRSAYRGGSGRNRQHASCGCRVVFVPE